MNRPVYAKNQIVYNTDSCVVREGGKKFTYHPGMDAEMEPVIIVEVLSKNTRDHDLEEKLPDYKAIPSVRQIIYAENRIPYLTVYTKNEAGNWDNRVFDNLEDAFEIMGRRVSLRQVYHKVGLIERR